MKRRKVAKELQETVQTVQRAEGEGAEACEPPSGRAKKKAKPTKAKRAGKVKTTPPKSTKDAAEAFWPEVIQVLDDLADPNARGTLSDRLNPSHPRFDKKLKASWKGFSKKERAAIVDCDQKKMKATVSATVSIEHPFDVNDDDHCETSLEAYRDVVPILHHFASLLSRLDEDEEHVEYSQAILVLGKLLLQSFSLILHTTLQGKSPKKLRIYDPFFCAGSVVKHLAELGFPKVYNKCEETTGIQGTRVLGFLLFLSSTTFCSDKKASPQEHFARTRKRVREAQTYYLSLSIYKII
ncbi:unnamed protein product [Durusdinium trenchii]|uniref:PiggyBac transposable element-derived protein domain-containing protein n=1 Tax=Durusdinium trenchii TaxID=1381693 RepID=A0ABP0IH33_9DINO